jgi:hypothetical protein
VLDIPYQPRDERISGLQVNGSQRALMDGLSTLSDTICARLSALQQFVLDAIIFVTNTRNAKAI